MTQRDTTPMSEEELETRYRKYKLECECAVSELFDEIRHLRRELEGSLSAEDEAVIARSAAAEEREACAKYLDAVGQPGYAAAIRARGKPDVQPAAPGEVK